MQSLREIFYSHEGNLIHKWDHYFEIYERYFEKYRGCEVNLLEIGVSQGGSIQMWKKYFGDKLKIYSVDINPECTKFKDLTTKLYIGSQEDPSFLKKLKDELPPMDIIIDDGGHTMKQQIMTFEYLYLKLKDNGIYLVEDTHTSYWNTYGGGLKKRGTFIEYSKNIIDSLHNGHLASTEKLLHKEFAKHINSISYYDSIVVFEKKQRELPFHIKKGVHSINDYKTKSTFWSKIRFKVFGRDDVIMEKNINI
jgi:hypothetical protein